MLEGHHRDLGPSEVLRPVLKGQDRPVLPGKEAAAASAFH
jgi:hypothetical protein